MKLKKVQLLLGVVLAVFALSIIPVPVKSFYFEDQITAGMWVPLTHGGYTHTDYWYYRHQNEMWGELDGQGHYLSITWDWEAWCNGAVVYYRRDFYMKLANGYDAHWYDEWMGHKVGGFPKQHYYYPYHGVAPQYRPIKFSVHSIVAFSTMQM